MGRQGCCAAYQLSGNIRSTMNRNGSPPNSPLKHRNIFLACLELCTVTQHSYTSQCHPRGRIPVVSSIWLVLACVCLDDLVVEPQMSHCHAVLCQCAGLVRADGRGGAECLDSLQVLHQAVLACHTLSSQGQTHLQITKQVLHYELSKSTFPPANLAHKSEKVLVKSFFQLSLVNNLVLYEVLKVPLYCHFWDFSWDILRLQRQLTSSAWTYVPAQYDKAGCEHATQCVRLVHTDALRIAPQRQTISSLIKLSLTKLTNEELKY